jgi:hypothetical protein
VTDQELIKRFEHVDKRFDEIVELARSIETTLLKEFRRWAVSFESRFRANEILVGGFNETAHWAGGACGRYRAEIREGWCLRRTQS